ncbi:hypothetical protein BGZ54_008996 [Gamsiella multidivaricata]|nr:hypothetical protein BGZ54_008996 [Gamsiella multidivaricata]
MADTDVEMTTAGEAVPQATTQTTENVPAPSPSLYIKNLNEKIKLDVLKKSLRTIFGQYGEVLDIVAHSNIRMRGQAFVIFGDKDVATKAMSEVQGFPLYGKPMVIQYSKKKFANEFKPKKRQAMLFAKQQQKMQEQQRILEEQQQLLLQQQQLSQQGPYGHLQAGAAGAAGAAAVPGAAIGGVPMIPDEYLPRNSILFLQNLPHDVQESQLVSLFQQYPGFKEVRTVPGKSGIAFVEYDNEYYSAAAKTALADYQIAPEHKMKVTFARK